MSSERFVVVGIVGEFKRMAALAGPVAVLGIAAALLAPGTASATDLVCTPGAQSTALEGKSACGVQTDVTSNAYARALDGVTFARAELGGAALGLAGGGGVAAAETKSGTVAAVSTGVDSVSIVSPDTGALALAVSLDRGQTFVGTADEGVQCHAGAGLAVNVTTGQVCLSDGVRSWSSVVALP